MKRISILLLTLLLLSTLTFAQRDYRGLVSDDFRHRFEDYGFNLDGDLIGPRGMGMGGANIAATGDPTGIFFNPATTSTMVGLNVTVSGRMNFDSQDHQHPKYSGMAVRTTNTPLATVNFATATYSLQLGNRTLALGLGYRYLRDMNLKLVSTQFYYGGLRINENESTRGGVQALSPSISFELLPSLAVGATVNKVFGESKFELKLISPFADQLVYFQFNDGEKYSGTSADAGLLWQPVSWLSLGATYSPAWDLSIEEQYEKLTALQGQTLEHQKYETPEDSLANFTAKIPAKMGFGMAIKPFKYTTLNADLRVQKWSEIDVTSSLGDINPISTKLADATGWFAGIEQIIPGANWNVPVRAGIFSQATPYKDRLFKGTYEGDQLKMDGWSLGIGVHSDWLKVDFAFSRSSYNVGWWMTASDYYNNRLFQTTERFNRVLIAFTYSL